MKTGDKSNIPRPLMPPRDADETVSPNQNGGQNRAVQNGNGAVADAGAPNATTGVAGVQSSGVHGAASTFDTLQTPKTHLGLDQLDALWAKGDFPAVVSQLEKELTPLQGKLKSLDGASTGRWISELHVLQHRGISLANKISMKENPAAAKQALGLLQTIANLQTEVFERAVSLADAKTPDKAVPAWIVHKDTMKKAGFHSPDARQQYFVDKARSFIEKGGDLNQIEAVTPEALAKYKSGQFVEWVVDSYDVARITPADSPVSPGHTLLAWGGDALSAGTLRLFKDDAGKITQAVIGTFSGHFRSGKETLHHLARHLVAAGVPPEAVVLQGGEAGSARALEVLRRAMGTDGAAAQTEQAQLDAAAQRHNPYAPSVHGPAPQPSDAEKALYDSLFRLRLTFDTAFDDGVIHQRPDGRMTQIEQLVSSIDHALTAAEIAESPVAFQQVMSVLDDLMTMESPIRSGATNTHLKSLKAKWAKHNFGDGAIHAADLLSAPPIADRNTRILVELTKDTSPEQMRSMLRAGADVAHVSATEPGAKGLIKMAREEAAKMGKSISIQVDIKDGTDPKTRSFAKEQADTVVADIGSANDIYALKDEMKKDGLAVPLIARIGTAKAVSQAMRIVFQADGIIIDRGRLAESLGAAAVPLREKMLHELGNRFGKATVVATEVFPSMAKSSRGTRAEVEGAYRAVADLGADGLFLDASTLQHDDPGNVVAFAGRVAERAESDLADRPYVDLKERGKGPADGTGVAQANIGTTTAAAPINADGESEGIRSPQREQMFARLNGPKLDALDAKGDDISQIALIDDAISKLSAAEIGKMDGEQLAATVGELHILQHRVIGLTNRISAFTDKSSAMAALKLLQPIADLQTVAFERSVAIDKKKNPNEPVAWIAHVDTMKKPGFSAPLSRLAYFAAKAEKFIKKGGNLDDIKNVDAKNLANVKSGVLQEFVVDAYDNARFYDATKDVTPGHTLAAFGEDALTAGTLRLYKDDAGEVTQAVIGTFSGHYRAGQESLHHMARHLVASGIPPERIVLQGGEAGGARALEVLHMATGLEGADAQRELVDTNARAATFNPYAVTTDEGTAAKGAKKDVVVQGVLPPADTQALVDAVEQMNLASVRLVEAPRPIQDPRELLNAIDDVLRLAEDVGNPMAYANARGLLKHWTSQTAILSPDASGLIHGAYRASKDHRFGSSPQDPANMIGPKPIENRRARIVATVDPKGTEASYRLMIQNGMNVARYNPAHATPQELRESMGRIRKAAAALGKDVAIQVDLTGPKIRLGTFANPDNKKFNDIFLTAGDVVTLTSGDVVGDSKTFPIDIDTIDDIKPGHRVFMNDGTVELVVKKVGKDKDGKPKLDADVITGGKVWDRKGVNLPDSALTEDTITDDDKKTLDAVLDLVDTVAVSFVRHPEDILRARQEMRDRGKIVPIIAKIERPEALEVLDKIAAVSDGMMVARGDLGVEIGPENVPAAERRIAKLGNSMGKPVMVATEVFASMAKENQQTKAETEGLFSAIAGLGVDAIMLGKETSFPENPHQTIRAASQVVEAAESVLMGKLPKLTDKGAPQSPLNVRLGAMDV